MERLRGDNQKNVCVCMLRILLLDFFLNYSNKVLIPMISYAYYIDIILLSDLFLFFLCLCLVVCSDGHGSSTYSFKESSSQVCVWELYKFFFVLILFRNFSNISLARLAVSSHLFRDVMVSYDPGVPYC